jgi:hypothetical protein
VNRRSLIVLLIGVLASLLGLLAATRLRARRCDSLGGAWDDARRSCRLPAGVVGESTLQTLGAYALGAAIAVLVAFMLWRAYLAATGRGPNRRT